MLELGNPFVGKWFFPTVVDAEVLALQVDAGSWRQMPADKVVVDVLCGAANVIAVVGIVVDVMILILLDRVGHMLITLTVELIKVDCACHCCC